MDDLYPRIFSESGNVLETHRINKSISKQLRIERITIAPITENEIKSYFDEGQLIAYFIFENTMSSYDIRQEFGDEYSGYNVVKGYANIYLPDFSNMDILAYELNTFENMVSNEYVEIKMNEVAVGFEITESIPDYIDIFAVYYIFKKRFEQQMIINNIQALDQVIGQEDIIKWSLDATLRYLDDTLGALVTRVHVCWHYYYLWICCKVMNIKKRGKFIVANNFKDQEEAPPNYILIRNSIPVLKLEILNILKCLS
jgi:hypothetical protein